MSNEEYGWVPPGPSRKAPCPCGSGRKYKKCCLQKRESEAFPVLWPKLNATLRELSQTLQEFASDTWGPRYVEHAWDDFWGGDAPVDVGTGPFSSLFATWYLFHWAPGKAIVLESEPLPLEDTIAAEYLREHGEGLEPLSRQYLETARLTPISFWQVESVVRERGLQMKDLATGKELFVNEVQATRHAAIWDLMLCKVISVDGTNVIDGAGPYVMPASAKPMVREFLDNQTSTGALSDTMLLRMQLDLVEYYRDCLEELKSAGPPEVRNTSGEKLVFTTTTYRFEPELRTELIQRLEAMKNITPGELRGPKVVFQWTVEGGRGRTMDGATRATLEVEADRLVCNTNSRERNATITRRLERELSRLLRHEQTTYKTLATALAETAAAEGAPGSGSESDGVLDLDKLSPEDRAALQAVVVEKYMSWADERVPALGGQTPRQAVSTPQGRQKVEDLLADWENRLARMPGHVPFDMNKLRAALGLLGE